MQQNDTEDKRVKKSTEITQKRQRCEYTPLLWILVFEIYQLNTQFGVSMVTFKSAQNDDLFFY